MFYCIFSLFCNGLLHLCNSFEFFIAYFSLFCNVLLHILHCFATDYCIFCIVFQWFIAYFEWQVVAGVMQRQDWWEIEDADEVKAATALLPFTQPRKTLIVWLRDSTPTRALHQLAATIKQTAFGGELVMWLWNSRYNFIPCDVKELHGAK